MYLSRGTQADRVAEGPYEGRQRHLGSGQADADAGRECSLPHAAHLEIHVPEQAIKQSSKQENGVQKIKTTRGEKNGKWGGGGVVNARAHARTHARNDAISYCVFQNSMDQSTDQPSDHNFRKKQKTNTCTYLFPKNCDITNHD